MAPAGEAAVAALRGATAVVPGAGGREVLVVTGADRVRFLQGMLVSDVERLAPGAGGRSAFLTPKGQVAADLWVFSRAADIRLVAPAGQGEATAAALGRYAVMDDVAIAPAGLVLLSVLGPGAAAALGAIGQSGAAGLAARPVWSHADDGGSWLVRVRELGADGFWVGGSAERMAAAAAALGAAGAVALDAGIADAVRIAAREPRWGAEIGPDYFPMEVGLGPAIDYGKGCYIGQEPIVRVRDRGHLNWRLCALRLGAGPLPHGGDLLESDARPKAGRITSAARLPDDVPRALALVHVSVPVGSALRVRHGDAVVPATLEAEV